MPSRKEADAFGDGSKMGREELLISIFLCTFAQIIEGDSPAFLIGIKGSPSGIG